VASRIRLKSSHRRTLLKDDKRPAFKSRVEPEIDRERVAASKTKKKRK
jgi:hypothetical protein